MLSKYCLSFFTSIFCTCIQHFWAIAFNPIRLKKNWNKFAKEKNNFFDLRKIFRLPSPIGKTPLLYIFIKDMYSTYISCIV